MTFLDIPRFEPFSPQESFPPFVSICKTTLFPSLALMWVYPLSISINIITYDISMQFSTHFSATLGTVTCQDRQLVVRAPDRSALRRLGEGGNGAPKLRGRRLPGRLLVVISFTPRKGCDFFRPFIWEKMDI